MSSKVKIEEKDIRNMVFNGMDCVEPLKTQNTNKTKISEILDKQKMATSMYCGMAAHILAKAI